MRQQLTQVWDAFLKNADVYVVIGIAVILSLFAIISTNSLQFVLSGTLAILALLAFSLLKNRQTDERMEHTLADMLKANSATNRAYSRQEYAYRDLIHYAETHVVNTATLVQYSCASAKDLVKALLSRGAKVTVYVQHEDFPGSLGSKEQVKRIRDAFDYLPSELGTAWDADKLSVYKYRVPGSISAVNIDDEVLAMSWYLYENIDEDNRNPLFEDDPVEVSGHDVAGLIVWKGTPEFDALKETFDRLVRRHKRHAELAPLVARRGGV